MRESSILCVIINYLNHSIAFEPEVRLPRPDLYISIYRWFTNNR